VRVISGQAKGRPLKAVPGNATRPTTDKVKEALFSIIGPYFDGDKVLDLFAGTGGLGIEALSRGAGSAVFVDASPRSVEVVRRNLDVTKLADKAEVYRNDARKAIKVLERKGQPFELVFLDPPYAIVDCDAILAELADRGLVSDDAVAVVEHASSVSYPDEFSGFRRFRHAVYGETALSVYRYHKEAGREQTDSLEASDSEGGIGP
jgi:16S rRNA (guanine966-N2)-methyltransferase